ncbi:MAG: hypothetical protein KME28_11805 [Pelatocladus maniniholoensis HA4357-MV3]|uniref:Uncharacterized protein n=1 Tax=Pelatocladus maniniholoensis HA4357-MV3 TaxID=1117104 RepID=A0A9E3LT39_9NOST|nr:hypothetical protein [Pelatocladus maniniholoensis HA4357-MV3]
MCQYLYNLLEIMLVAGSTMLVIPCQAQNLSKSNLENSNSNIISASSQFDAANTNIKSNLSNGDDSRNNQLQVISESTNNEPVTTKANQRIPISSRIFAVPSMQQ